MNSIRLKYPSSLLLVIVACMAIKTNAQQLHFIYIQTENKQPFYVKQDKKIMSSSASGYVIIPKLPDGRHNLFIGFPKSEWPEQNFVCTVDKKDNGYLLKNFGDKGWGLFNLQTMDVVMGGSGTEVKTVAKEGNDAYTNMLSNVVNDPSIKKTEPVKEEPKPVVVEQPKELPKELPKKEPVVEKPVITKLSGTMVDAGYEMIYIDKTDTIRLLIPAEKKPAPVVKEEAPKEADKKFIDIELPNPNETKEPVREEEQKKPMPAELVKPPVTENGKKPAMINSDCKAAATEDDFLKLRKKMAAEDNDDDMVAAARKVFKSKCFSTEQIKNLSVLFLKDEGKYKFFDASYPFVTDTDNFQSLEKQLTDEYFVNRFKVMIRH